LNMARSRVPSLEQQCGFGSTKHASAHKTVSWDVHCRARPRPLLTAA